MGLLTSIIEIASMKSNFDNKKIEQKKIDLERDRINFELGKKQNEDNEYIPSTHSSIIKKFSNKNNRESNAGVGLLRGAVLALPLLVILPIAVWYEFTFLWGFLSFLAGIVILGYIMNSAKHLTTLDIVLPFVLSIISAIIFFPVGLIAGNLFSAVTCILAGLMLSVGLGLFKAKRIFGWCLVVPTMCFIYEILPIDLPTDIDNIIGLGANGVNIFIYSIIKPAIGNNIQGLISKQKR